MQNEENIKQVEADIALLGEKMAVLCDTLIHPGQCMQIRADVGNKLYVVTVIEVSTQTTVEI